MEKKKLPVQYEHSKSFEETFYKNKGDDVSNGIMMLLGIPLLPFYFIIYAFETIQYPFIAVQIWYLKTFKKHEYDLSENTGDEK